MRHKFKVELTFETDLTELELFKQVVSTFDNLRWERAVVVESHIEGKMRLREKKT